MARLPKTLPELRDEQALATDPFAGAALSASAGSGKTQVLTARVYRLLLQGAAPESILCLTFTKAGAAEMANRIGTRLAAWVRMKPSELKTDLVNLGERVTPQLLEDARRLFARVLDAPGGLRIQTIHSFAQSLLSAFPAEAGITPGLEPLEGRAAEELAHRTLAELLADAEASGNEALIADVQRLSLRLGERAAVDYLRQCARRYEQLQKLGDPAAFEGKLRQFMGLPEGSAEDYIAGLCGDEGFDCELLRAVAAANRRWVAQTGQRYADTIETWLALTPIERAAALPELRAVVMTAKDEVRTASAGQLKAEPDYAAHAWRLANLVGDLLDVQNGMRLAADMAAGLRAGRAFAEAFARAKRAAGVAEFDDLIVWTRELLRQPGMGDWVRYKLDRRTDHILVDEAQDTNADQWSIILGVADDFFSGASEADRRWRTLLMVGDFKQAIYGFQGTDPREFNRVRDDVGNRVRLMREAEDEADSGIRLAREFRDLSIAESFRSAQPILDVVDKTIDVVGWERMGLPDPPRRHRACEANEGMPGLVELWKLFELAQDGDDDADEETWLDLRERRYAERLAAQIKQWIDEAPLLASTGLPLTAGDVLVLVRSRGELAALIVARLFSAGVPVAGIDRLHLQEPLAVQDLLSAMTFAVQPLDDLNLASLLVSPLIGWTQEQLLEVAWGREGRLWPAIRDRARTDDDAARAVEALGSLLRMADFTTPAQFLETILSGPMEGRRKLARRLTMAARDPIDELMSSALEFERGEIASLERFLAWFRRGDVEITRDPSAPANEVRVMTVHGAKGLEAPVVIIADAHADPKRLGRQNPPLDILCDGAKVPVVRPRKAERVTPFDAIVEEEQALALEEHWRLLYVGMTRAKERLVIAGLKPKRGQLPQDSWHAAVTQALERLPAESREDERWGSVVAFGTTDAAGKRRVRPVPEPVPMAAVPGWALRPAPPEARPPRPLAPSAIAVDDEAAPPPSEAMRMAARRGTLIHQLLERLVEIHPDSRHGAATRWLERSAGVDDGALRTEIADQVCGILADPRFGDLFGPGSLGEAPLAATLPDGRVIAGTVDRLLVEPRRISVIDFKTGRVPETDAKVPNSHRAQMAAYAEALAVIFPEREIRAALLYTAGPKLIELMS